MTQSLANNLDILSKTVCDTTNQKTVNPADVNSDKKTSDKFDSILDKTIDKKTYTLGEIKNSDGDMSEKIENFKNVLIQATREVNMEKSLDLTLAKDITEIIDQLKPAINNEIADEESEQLVDTSDLADEESEQLVDTSDLANEDDEKTSAVEIPAEPQPMFEQLLTFINAAKSETEISQVNASAQEESVDIESPKTVELKIMPQISKEENAENEADSAQTLDKDMLNELKVEISESQTDSQAGEDTARQESPEEVGIKIMLNNNDDKINVQFEKQINLNTTKPAEVTSEKIIEQITKHMDSLKTSSKLTMTLNPDSLGKINLQILNSKDGLSAQFTVMTNDVRELLMKGLDGLKEALLAQGVNVDNISVKVSDTKEPYNPDWTEQENSENSKNEQQKQRQEEKEKGLFEKTIAKSLDKENGNL